MKKVSESGPLKAIEEKRMKNLTKKEIANLPWAGAETHALVNREDKSMPFTADSRELLRATLVQMTEKHPLYYKLQLVERPK